MADIWPKIRDNQQGVEHLRVLRVRTAMLGDRHPAVARALNGLGMLLRAEGHYREAEPLFRQALAIDRAVNADDVQLSQSLYFLAEILADKGDPAAAESFAQEALALRRRNYGEAHPDVMHAQLSLARLRRDRGDIRGADSLFRSGLALGRKLLGDDHYDVAFETGEYALLLHRMGDTARAELLFRQSIAQLRRALAPEQRFLARVLTLYGGFLLDRGQIPAAELSLREALDIQARVLPPNHWRTAVTQRMLATCLFVRGRYADAEPLLIDSHRTLRAQRGDHDAETQASQRELSRLYSAWRTPGDRRSR